MVDVKVINGELDKKRIRSIFGLWTGNIYAQRN